MSLGVSDYIPKLTMTEQEIEDILKKIQVELNQIHGSDQVHTSTGIDIDVDMAKEKLFKGFMFYNFYSADKFQTYICKMGLRLNQNRLIMCIMEIPYFELLQTRFKDEKGQLIKLSVLKVLNELLENSKRVWC
jgi:hypothetical protein